MKNEKCKNFDFNLHAHSVIIFIQPKLVFYYSRKAVINYFSFFILHCAAALSDRLILIIRGLIFNFSKHALIISRHHLDKLLKRIVPVVQHSSRHA